MLKGTTMLTQHYAFLKKTKNLHRNLIFDVSLDICINIGIYIKKIDFIYVCLY